MNLFYPIYCRVSRLSLLLLTVVPMLNLASCKRRQLESVRDPKSAASTDSKTPRPDKVPLSDRERLTRVLGQKLPMRQKMEPYAEDAVRMLHEGDREGFLKLTALLAESQLNGMDFGIELGKALDSEGREEMVEWLAEVPDPMIRFHSTSGVLGWSLAMDTTNALLLVEKLPPDLLAMKDPPLNSSNLEKRMWSMAGLLLVSDAPANKDRSALLAALSSKPGRMEAYAGGVAGAAQKAVDLGRNSSFAPILLEIPDKDRARALDGMMSGLKPITEEKSAPFSELLNVMKSTESLADSTYFKLGRLLDFKVLETISSQIPEATTPATISLVKGWASQSPAKAVESLTGSRPELVPAAFSAWVEADSIEASKWLGSQGDGRVSTDCTVELCKYLIASGASEQAAGWMAKLPEERRQEIEKLMPK